MTRELPPRCAVCGGDARGRTVSPRLFVATCRACGHQRAVHAGTGPTDRDYHDQYDQDAFIDALRATRSRQAKWILGLVRQRCPNAHRLLDFGCGRGWFLEEAGRAGFDALCGADASEKAVDALRAGGVPAVLVSSETPAEGLDPRRLPFRPQVIALLDVLEHFSTDQAHAVLGSLLERFRPELELVVIKVPVSSGLLHRAASSCARLGMSGLLEQLYQVGTSPPHLCYFSRPSLERFVASAGLEPATWARDRDFEPEWLGTRARALSRLPRWAPAGFGHAIALAARALRMEDSLLCIATPRGVSARSQ